MSWFLTLNSHNLVKFWPISPSSTSFENYKARQTFLDHFWRPNLPNKTENLIKKGAILCCRNCILSEFTNMLPDNARSCFWSNLWDFPFKFIITLSPSQFSKGNLTMNRIVWNLTYNGGRRMKQITTKIICCDVNTQHYSTLEKTRHECSIPGHCLHFV